MITIYDLDTPALLVDLDLVERNVADMAGRVARGGKRLRPHTKTHKTAQLARMQIGAGAAGLTVAKLAEAEALLSAGFDDFFVANEIVGAQKVARLLALSRRARLRVGVDSVEAAAPIAAAAAHEGMTVPVLIEVDTGYGRAGARSAEEALALVRFVSGTAGLHLAGIFTYEGQVYRQPDAAERERVAQRAAQALRNLAAAMAAQGTPAAEISVGSTPGSVVMAHEPGITEMRCGVYIFNDRTHITLGGSPEDCALTVIATVISVRPDGRVVLDAGVKALAGDCTYPDRCYGAILGRPDLAFPAATEEHGHLQATGEPRLRVGDRLRIIPIHACTCVNMHDSMVAHRGERVEDTWPIIGRGKLT